MTSERAQRKLGPELQYLQMKRENELEVRVLIRLDTATSDAIAAVSSHVKGIQPQGTDIVVATVRVADLAQLAAEDHVVSIEMGEALGQEGGPPDQAGVGRRKAT